MRFRTTITTAVSGEAAVVGRSVQEEWDARFEVTRHRVEQAYQKLGADVKVTWHGSGKAKKIVIEQTFEKDNAVEARKSALYWFNRMCREAGSRNTGTGLNQITAVPV